MASDPPRDNASKWLDDCDRQVADCPQLDNWGQHGGLFIPVRNKHLRPSGPIPDAIERTLADWEVRLSEERRLVQDLDQDQIRELAALVCDTVNDFEAYATRRAYLSRLLELAATETRHAQKINRLLDRAKSAMNELADYAPELARDVPAGYPSIQNARKGLEEVPMFRGGERFAAAHAELVGQNEDDPAAMDPTEDNPAAEDPTQFAMVKVFALLRRGFGLSANEAEARTGLIRNRFWTAWAKPVDLRLEWKDGSSIGCEAVHAAVLRFP